MWIAQDGIYISSFIGTSKHVCSQTFFLLTKIQKPITEYINGCVCF